MLRLFQFDGLSRMHDLRLVVHWHSVIAFLCHKNDTLFFIFCQPVIHSLIKLSNETTVFAIHVFANRKWYYIHLFKSGNAAHNTENEQPMGCEAQLA